MLRVAEYAQRTDTGRQRRANEDAHFARTPLFVIADGMGGAQAGEVASGTAVEVLAAGLPDGSGSVEERLAARVSEANRRVHELSITKRDLAGMGTTVTAAYVGEHEVAIAHVGDSRAYLLRDGVLERLTHDHSLVEEFVRQGKLTPEEADEHPQRSIITRALGPEPDVEVDRLSVRGRDGDVFLVCSDGLTSMVPEARVADLARAADSLEGAARDLIDAANDAGGRDNITVVLFRLEELDTGLAEETRAHAVDDPAAQDTTTWEVDGGSEHTVVGETAPTVEEVRAAVAAAPAVPAPEAAPIAPAAPLEPEADAAPRRRLAPRPPRAPQPAGERRRRRRWLGPIVIAAIILFPIAGGAYLASQAVFFLGVGDDGAVTVYKGVPYTLPGGLELYTPEYVTGLTAEQVPVRRRNLVFGHDLRSQDDARDIARELELGQISGR